MRKILFSLLFSIPFLGFAQVQSPVSWSFSSKKIGEGKNEVHLTATIQPGWHTYSQTTPDGGPAPTNISFNRNPLVAMQGSIKEIGKLEQHNEPLFGVDVKQFSNTVDFVQIVSVKANAKTAVAGSVEYMVCNNRECLPLKEVKFSIPIK
jgi:DsbC/DsbD-like thiol-disulfide interchange protein